MELLGRWIDQGAAWQEHWAFIPPQRPPVPAVPNSSWIRDPIVAFILSRLKGTGLDPSTEADKLTLIRRVSFDLTGLPPELGEIDAFVSDDSPHAYQKVVDRLLASVHYGERMASDWLDLARYADTYGYQNDRPRSVWPYRDWVIRAFNDNLSYDRFITWQLAGDLLEEPTRDQRLATAFNRLHRQRNEGGSVEEEYRVEYVADRAPTLGTAMLGLTTECARCHDHKYDPILRVEFYRLFAFFNSIDESGLYSHFTDAVPTPTLRLTTPEQKVRIGELESQVARAEHELSAVALSRRAAFDEWLSGPSPDPVMSDKIGDYSFDSLAENQPVNRADAAKPGKALDKPQLVDGVHGKAVRLDGEKIGLLRVGEMFGFKRQEPQAGQRRGNPTCSLELPDHVKEPSKECADDGGGSAKENGDKLAVLARQTGARLAPSLERHHDELGVRIATLLSEDRAEIEERIAALAATMEEGLSQHVAQLGDSLQETSGRFFKSFEDRVAASVVEQSDKRWGDSIRDQHVIDVEMTSRPDLDGHIARIERSGFMWNGTIIRNEQVVVFKLEQ